MHDSIYILLTIDNTSRKPLAIVCCALWSSAQEVFYRKSEMVADFVDNVPIAVECFSMTYTYKVIMANGVPPGDQQIIQASLHDSLKVDSFILEYALAL